MSESRSENGYQRGTELAGYVDDAVRAENKVSGRRRDRRVEVGHAMHRMRQRSHRHVAPALNRAVSNPSTKKGLSVRHLLRRRAVARHGRPARST